MADDNKKANKEKITVREAIYYLSRTLKWAFLAHKTSFVLLFVLITLVALLPFLADFLTGKVIDELTQLIGVEAVGRDLQVLWTLIILAAGVQVLERVLWILQSVLEKISYFSIDRYFNKKFLEKSSQLEVASFEDSDRYILFQKARDIAEWKPREAAFRMVWVFNGFVRVFFSFVVIATFSIPALIFVVLMTLPSIFVKVRLGKESWGMWDATAKEKAIYWNMHHYLTNEEPVKEITIFNSRNYLLKKLFGVFDNYFASQIKHEKRKALWESIFGNMAQIGIIGFWILAIFAVLNGEITIGLLTFYIASMSSFSNALYSLIWYVTNQYEDSRFLRDFFRFIDLPKLIPNGKKVATFDASPEIEFRGVSFKYPKTDKTILKNFSFKFSSGQKYAIVGANGAGKSTLIKLICRFYDVDQGEILINGINIREYEVGTLYKHIGVLFQSFTKFDYLTPRDNVMLGDIESQHSDERVMDSLVRADAEEFVAQLPNGINQILTKSLEGGVDLSGGQWQKLALARGFYRDAEVLILDEPTSSIDAVAEAEIFERLFDHIEGKTVLIISHRFSTVRRADKILVIDEGVLIESGTHDELIELQGVYAKAFNIQAEGYR